MKRAKKIKKKRGKKKEKKALDKIGWREWVSFPDLKVKSIKAKFDTGARTSALHVSDIRIDKKTNVVKFKIHPIQRISRPVINASALMAGERSIKSSNGVSSVRPVIIANIKIGEKAFPLELSLVNRDLMGFRLLLGRSALKKRYLVDSGKSFLLTEKIKVKKGKK